jgi:acetaldehyde dehydrogenase/alcohol dehydrogenase
MVKAAYESGHPSIGVGAGNTPAVIDETADIPMAVSSILISKTFDNGVICASEQNIVAHEAVSHACQCCNGNPVEAACSGARFPLWLARKVLSVLGCIVQVYEQVKAELKLRGGYIMSPEECKKAGNTIIKDGRLNAGAIVYSYHDACSADSACVVGTLVGVLKC